MVKFEELVKGCIENDRKSQRELYELFAPKMLGVCMRYATDKPEAEDFLQEGFVKVFTKLNTLKSPEMLPGWVRRIMVNTALEIIRKNKKFKNNLSIEEAYGFGVEEDVLDLLSAADIIKIIQNLPDGYRTVFNLYAIEGYSHKEIAEKLEISEGTSKSQYSRAKGLLKSKLAEREEIEKKIYETGQLGT